MGLAAPPPSHDARALISIRTLRYCQVLQLSNSCGMPASRQITSPGFSWVSRTRPSSKVISFWASVSGTMRYGSRCWCHGCRWPGSSARLQPRTNSFSKTILSPIGPSVRLVAVSAAMIDLLSGAANFRAPDHFPIQIVRVALAHWRHRRDVVVGPDQNQGIARAAHDLMKASADVEQRTFAQAAVERSIPVRNHHVFQAGNVRGNVGAASNVGEIERDEAVLEEIMQPQRAALRSVQDGVGNAVADTERPAVGLDHGPVAGV